jgi:O-antigen ligase
MSKVKYIYLASLFLFIYSGFIKWLPFPLDPTLLFFLLTLIFAVPLLPFFRLKQNTFLVLIAYACFVGYMCFTAIYTISDHYWQEKLLRILFNSICLVLPLIFIRNEDDWKAFKGIYIFFSCVLLFILVVGYIKNGLSDLLYYDTLEQYIQLKYPEYISLSLFLCTTILLIESDKNVFFKIPVILLCVFFILVLGARGPIIFLIPTLVYLKLQQHKLIPYAVAASILITVAFFLFENSPYVTRIKARMAYFSEGEKLDNSTSERIMLFTKSISIIKEYPLLGVGVGGFGTAFQGEDKRLSPHNIFLEVVTEAGVIGLAFFLFFLISLLLSAYTAGNGQLSYPLLVVKAACLLLFFELLVSSIMEDLRITTFWIGVLLALKNMKTSN